MTTVTDHEADQIGRANADDRPPVVFVHGLWPAAMNAFGSIGWSPWRRARWEPSVSAGVARAAAWRSWPVGATMAGVVTRQASSGRTKVARR